MQPVGVGTLLLLLQILHLAQQYQHGQDSHKIALQEIDENKRNVEEPKCENKETFDQMRLKIEVQERIIEDLEDQVRYYNQLLQTSHSKVLQLEQQLHKKSTENEHTVPELTKCNSSINTKTSELLTLQRQFETCKQEREKMESEQKQLKVLAGEAENIRKIQAVNKAVQQNNLENVKILLEAGLSTETVDSYGWRPLHNASYEGHLQIVRLLVEHGANVTARVEDRFETSSIALAAINGHTGVVQFLLDQGVPVDIRNKYYQTPLGGAAWNGRYNVAELLLKKGADVNPRNIHSDSRTPLHSAAYRGHEKVAKLLLDHGADINALTKFNETALHWAAYNGNLEVAKLLVEHRINVHAMNTSGKTAKQVAAEKNFTNVVAFLDSL